MEQTELDPSKLGTLEYWEETYEKEIENFEEFGDEGEVWFGVQSVRRILNWFKSKNVDKNSSIIDIGCGNGYTTYKLAEEGYKKLHGIDYSEKAIILSDSICKKAGFSVKFDVVDVLTERMSEHYDIAIDKGTYDAIGLSPIEPKEKRYKYKEFVKSILKNNSIFLITSCNWTANELVDFFAQDKEFEFLEEIKSQSNFSFGGKTGSTTSTVAFLFKSFS